MIELKGITWDHPRGYLPLEASSEKFLAGNAVSVRWDRRTLKEFGDRSIEELAKIYDLLVIDHPHIGVISETKSLINLENYLKPDQLAEFEAESVGPSFQSYRNPEGLWAIPLDASCQAAAYRADMITKESTPLSWKDFFIFSDRLKARGQYVGTAFCPTDANCIFLTLAAQAGFSVAQTRDILIAHNEGRQILELIRKIYKASHPDSVYWNPVDLYQKMNSGDSIVYCPLAFAYCSYSSLKNKNKILFTESPGEKNTLLGGTGIAISASSRNIQFSLDYIKFVCDPAYQQRYYWKDGGQPAQLSSWLDEEANIEYQNFFKSLLPSIKQSYIRPQSSQWPEFQEWLGEAIHQFILRELEVNKTISNINLRYQNFETYKKR